MTTNTKVKGKKIDTKYDIPIELYPNSDEIVAVVRKTKDYSKFNLINVNRTKCPKNLKNLEASMAKEAFNKPILVTYDKENHGKYWVVDGQHTLEVRETLGLPVYYELLTHSDKTGLDSTDLKEEVIVRALCAFNSTGKNWTAMNFIVYYAERDFDGIFKDYTLLLKFMQEYPKIKHLQPYITLGQGHFRSQATRREGQYEYIKEGRYKFYDWDLACRRADYFMLYLDKLNSGLSAVFKQAIIKIVMMEHLNIDHDKFSSKLRTKMNKLPAFTNMEDYLLIMTDIYNSSKRNDLDRVNFVREYKLLKRKSVRDGFIDEEKKQIDLKISSKKT